MRIEYIENIISYISEKLQERGIVDLGKTKLYKLLRFASLIGADMYGELILDDYFVKLPYGPVPQHTKNLIESVENGSYIPSKFMFNGSIILHKQLASDSYLSETIKKILDTSIAQYGAHKYKDLSVMSHNKAWSSAVNGHIVDISIDMGNSDLAPLVRESYMDNYHFA